MVLIRKTIKTIQEEGILVFLKKFYTFLGERFSFLFFPLLPYLLFKMRKTKVKNLEESVNFAFNGVLGLIKPAQIKEEIYEFLNILTKSPPKTILEIGTMNGGTLFLFSRVAPEGASIISIDLPGGKFGGGYPRWKIPFYKSFAARGQRISLIREDSHKKETLANVEKILNGEKLDLLFIDGDHSYEGVKRDFEMYSPLVKKGGVIAFHDIAVHSAESGCFVRDFWGEVKRGEHRYKELIKDSSQGWAGIGILFLET